ncbi:MAG: LuxR family transcriptional regulator [Hoeflea sp.]|uniref:helix-turn-helix transcriptional regulator n=1 Tax=Hoeflea sp. TaxID=1940281 RepID=UPI001DD61865|nr:LuxR family transcriptional regulator [Hoeflea sp.]MBU4527303.1 LuxR family transcriptional regulator [Alphaproteobacteria bacterium]MBU4546914.1 LuxR family transcriptional regulator [Alphaproteobacteria bacterium]MBU4551574.1 LuxR family transcriptional regulator [Alphaproteobacteria bacterium]MBV1725579.1 LuxR family transcriptional regulator [Hoeflea sp.]MBV1759627.1 LuxR family transcriptional regulator [Hoeflea sp.]
MIGFWLNDGLILMKGHPTLVTSLNAIRTEADLSGFLRELATDFGLKGYMVIDIPTAADEKLAPRVALSDLPSGFLKDYDSLGLLKNSPIFAGLRRSTAPVIWSIDTIGVDRPSAEVDAARRLFTRHGISTSVYFPVHGANGRRAVLGFVGDRPAIGHTEMGELGIFVMQAYDVYSNLRTETGGGTAALTARELEVLHWVACGKTSGEIADIVALSDHTVNSYMNNAMRKLDCVNRTHLVAKAMRLHLIS